MNRNAATTLRAYITRACRDTQLEHCDVDVLGDVLEAATALVLASHPDTALVNRVVDALLRLGAVYARGVEFKVSISGDSEPAGAAAIARRLLEKSGVLQLLLPETLIERGWYRLDAMFECSMYVERRTGRTCTQLRCSVEGTVAVKSLEAKFRCNIRNPTIECNGTSLAAKLLSEALLEGRQTRLVLEGLAPLGPGYKPVLSLEVAPGRLASLTLHSQRGSATITVSNRGDTITVEYIAHVTGVQRLHEEQRIAKPASQDGLDETRV